MVNCFYQSNDLKFGYGHTKALPHKNVLPHVHDNYELYYFLSGDVTYYIEGQSYDIRSGDILIMNDQELHRPVFNSSQIYERIVINFKPEYISSFQNPEYDLLFCYRKRKLGHNNIFNKTMLEKLNVKSYFDRIETAIKKNLREKDILIKITFIEVLIALNNIFSKYKKDIVSLEKDSKITSIVNYINNNLEKNITLEDLAQKFYISKYYLCHSFKKNTGFTIIEYISYKRIIKAKELLASGMPVSETCFAVGYKDYSNFYKAFKKMVGLSPNKFKN